MNGLTLRICGPADGPALLSVAERDSAPVPAGRVLAAEIDGELIAAIAIASGRVVADPFVPTADAVELLRRRADQIRRAERRRGLPYRLWPRSSAHAAANASE